MSKYKTILCGLVAITLLLAGCMSSKHAGQLSLIGKLYHNTTSRYNGYYYARIKMKETETAIIDGRRYDYSKLLPLFLAGNPEDEAVSGGDLDSVIKKLTVVAKLHPLSKWADDCYFNIGKAYFYKQNYESALATFQYVSSEYKNADSKKKKGSSKGGKPQTSQQKLEGEYETAIPDKKSPLDFLKHKSIRSEDLLWMVRSFINLEQYGEAQAILSYILNDPTFPEKWKDERAMVHSYLYIQMKNYESAIDPLKAAIDLTKNKREKTRLTYLLAQLYELVGNTKLAAETYDQVTQLKPDYEMDFYARINLAKSYVASGTGSPEEIIKKLEQMAHDEKYEEFYDQIYFTIAEIYLQQGNTEEAIKNFETSIEKSISNNHQKGLSFLKIGEFYFEDQDYLTAQPNYDSAVAFLDSKFELLDEVKSLQKILDNLARQVHIILLQDSLQKLAKMDEKERNKILDEIVFQAQKQNDNSSGDSLLQSDDEEEEVSSGTTGGWYFYNTNLKSAGYNEFQKLWGGRKNEDNWRRLNKNSGISDENADNNLGELIEEDGKITGELTREALLAGLPMTEEKMLASNNKIFAAYYALGMIYKNDLRDNSKAIETFEKLASRFSNHSDMASVYYNLYLLHSKLNNYVKAEQYKQLILQNHPTSNYAGILSDPDYFTNLEEQSKQVDVYYASTYDFYVQENYAEVLKRIESAQATFKSNPLQPKFDLLEAFAIGKTQNKEAFISALDSVVTRHPQGIEHDKAVEILTLLGVNMKSGPNNSDPKGKVELEQNKPAFSLHPENPHFVIVYFPKISTVSKPVSDSLANFNVENYSLENLKVSSQLLDAKQQMVVVKSFKDVGTALDYFDEINDWGGHLQAIGDEEYETFFIDDKNFQTLYQKKNIEEYLDFFGENY